MITTPIKIILMEDNPDDVKLLDYHIKKIVESPEILVMHEFERFTKEVHSFKPDVIFSDYKMNGFNGMDVLAYVTKNTNVSNFIFVTGTIYDEELAAETILNGATGYILKKHMPVMSAKLLPYFEEIVASKSTSKLPDDYEEMFNALYSYIDNAKKENQAIRQSYYEMRKTLVKYNYLKNDS